MNALEQRRFWNGVDLHLGAIEQTNAREREREMQKSTNNININIKIKKGMYA